MSTQKPRASRFSRKEAISLHRMLQEASAQQFEKLLQKAAEGRSGWEAMSPQDLWDMLCEHVNRVRNLPTDAAHGEQLAMAQAVDIANLCAMLMWHGRRLEARNRMAKLQAEMDDVLVRS